MPKNYKDYEKQMAKAIDAYKRDPTLKKKALAQEYEVNYKTLCHRLQGRPSKSERPGANKALDSTQEAALVAWIERLDGCNCSPTPEMIENCANSILARATPADKEPPTVSGMWAYRFIERLPSSFHRVKQKPMDRKRIAAEQLGIIQTFFDRLRIQIRGHGIGPANFYNFDETNFQPGKGKAQTVVTQHPERISIPHEHQLPSLSAIECVAADGFVLPPLFILPGTWHMESWYQDTELPEEYCVAPQKNGYTNDSIAFQWIQHFHEHTKDRVRRGGYRLLLCDGHGSHLTQDFIEFCDEHRIIIYCLPPHTSHLLQPLDGKPFQQYKHYFQKQNNWIERWGGATADKSDFLRGIPAVREKTFTKRTIRDSFTERGLWPLKPSLVLERLEKCRLPTPEIEGFHPNGTPEPSSSPTTIGSSPPKSVYKLRKGIERIQKGLDDLKEVLDEQNPRLRKRLSTIFEGSLIQAELASQHGNEVELLLRHKQQREAKKSKRRVQKGGVLTVKDALRAIDARELEDIERLKAKKARTDKRIAQKKALDERLVAETPQRARELGIQVEDGEELPFIIDTHGA